MFKGLVFSVLPSANSMALRKLAFFSLTSCIKMGVRSSYVLVYRLDYVKTLCVVTCCEHVKLLVVVIVDFNI